MGNKEEEDSFDKLIKSAKINRQVVKSEKINPVSPDITKCNSLSVREIELKS